MHGKYSLTPNKVNLFISITYIQELTLKILKIKQCRFFLFCCDLDIYMFIDVVY